MSPLPLRQLQCALFALVLQFTATLALAQPTTAPTTAPAPREWIDPDTGHRIHRLTDEPNSTGFYFNMNAFTPDGKRMIYSAPDGIHVLDLSSNQARLLVASKDAGQMRTIMVGHKTPTLYFINN